MVPTTHTFSFSSACMQIFLESRNLKEAYNNQYNLSIRDEIAGNKRSITDYKLSLAELCHCSPEAMFSFFEESFQLNGGSHTNFDNESDFSIPTMKRFLAARGIEESLLLSDTELKDRFHACRLSILKIKYLLAELAGCATPQEVHDFFRDRGTGDVAITSDAGLVANVQPSAVVPPACAVETIPSTVLLPIRPELKFMNRRIRRILERNNPLEVEKMYKEEHEMQVLKKKIAMKTAAKKQRIQE